MRQAVFRSQVSKDTGWQAKTLMCLSLIFVCVLCAAQIRGGMALLSLLLFVYLGLAVVAAAWHKTIPFLLFFLPWSPLLKLFQGGISCYTVAVLLVCAIHFARCGWSLRPYQVFCTAFIAAFTLSAKALQGNSISMSYLFFLTMLVLFPCVTGRDAYNGSFFELTIFFSVGIISAALIAQRIAGYPNISQYIKVDSYLTITRLSGFFGDPNFYSAHITACFAGIQILLVEETRPIVRFPLTVIAVMLVYCGLLSASKSFAVVLAVQFFVWIIILLGKRNRGSVRFRVLIGIVAAALVMLSSSGVQELLRILDTRFSFAANASQITTGRTELWKMYIREIANNPVLLMTGEGYTPVTINGRASHNTILQGFFQFGLICFPVLIYWMVQMMKDIRKNRNTESASPLTYLLLLGGVMLPWLSLDILFFDEFFLLPVYMMLVTERNRSV